MASVDITSSGITFRITYTQTSDVATNKSVVTVTKLQIKTTTHTGLYYFDGDITIDGKTVVDMSSSAGSHRASINATGTFYNVSGTLGSATITHESDGTQTVDFALKSVAGWYNASSKKWTISGSKSVALTTIPRVSTFSVGNGTLGVEQNITVTKQNASFSHTITYKCGVAKGTVCEKSTATTIKFTPPMELAEQNTSGTSLSITYTLQTYSGSTAVGSTTSKTVTLTIPASVKPVCSLSYMDETGNVDRFGGYVQGVSKLLVAVLGEPAHYSPIVSYKTKIGNSTYTEATFSAPLTVAGEQTITATVTDGRGRSSDEVVETINVLAYAPPKISAFSVHRCNEDGTENSIGSFAKVTYSYSITSLADQNGKYITLRYKKSNDAEYTAIPMESVYSAENAEYIFAADDGASYTITLEVADSLNTSQRSTSVSTADVIMHFRADAKGMGMGKVSEKANALDMGWDIELNDHNLLKNGDPAFAPAGYGLGEYVASRAALADANSAVLSGWYYINSSTANGVGASATLVVDGYGSKYATQTAILASSGQRKIRHLINGTWGEWGYDVPSLDLLWQNASPTSEFAAQSTTADPRGYRFLYIRFLPSTASSYHGGKLVKVGSGEYDRLVITDYPSAGFFTGTRTINAQTTANKVYFGNFNGVQRTSATNWNGLASANTYCIPTHIYGIK